MASNPIASDTETIRRGYVNVHHRGASHVNLKRTDRSGREKYLSMVCKRSLPLFLWHLEEETWMRAKERQADIWDVLERRVVHRWCRTSSPRAAQVIKASQILSAVQGDWEVNHLAEGSFKRKWKLGSKHIVSLEWRLVFRWKRMTALSPILCCIRDRLWLGHLGEWYPPWYKLDAKWKKNWR